MLLVGGAPIDTPDVAGAGSPSGARSTTPRRPGLAVTYFFLGTRTSSASVADNGSARGRFVGRPIVNAVTGEPDVIPVAVPGAFAGLVEVSTTTRVHRLGDHRRRATCTPAAAPAQRAWPATGTSWSTRGCGSSRRTLFPPARGRSLPVLTSVADQFDAHNRFHGGQLGLTADLTRGPVFVEATGKVALGESITVVRVSGQTVACRSGSRCQPPQVVRRRGARPAVEHGAVRRSVFAVLPEAAVKVGYRFRDRSRFYVGYNFLYLSDAVRPGDQVDRTVDPSQVPLLGRASAGGARAERPAAVLARSTSGCRG